MTRSQFKRWFNGKADVVKDYFSLDLGLLGAGI